MDNCTIDCIEIIGRYSREETCNFVTSSCEQDTVQFIQTYFCQLNQSFILLILMSAIVLLLVYYALNTLTNNYLTPCVEEFIEKLDLSQALAGVTFLAFANGAPDIITAVVAGASTSQSTTLIPFGSLYGASLFDMAFVLSMVIQFSPSKELTLKKREALIPLGFYIFGTVYLISVSLFYQKMNFIIALFFLMLYPIYIVFVIYDENKKRKEKKSILGSETSSIQKESEEGQSLKADEEEEQKQLKCLCDEPTSQMMTFQEKALHTVKLVFKYLFNYTIPPTSKNEWNLARSIISLLFAPIINCVSFGFIDSFQQTLFSVPYAAWFSIPPLILLAHSLYCFFKRRSPETTIFYSIYSFIIIVCWITEICSILINLLELLQLLTNINSVFLGLTVLAWANCIGDYLSITAFAKKGYASTAIAGIFSGPLFTFLLGFGISCTLNSIDGQYPFVIFNFDGEQYDKISDAIVLSVIAMAIGYMVWIFLRILRKNGVLKGFQHKFAKFYYVTFLFVALFLSILTDFYKTVQCDL